MKKKIQIGTLAETGDQVRKLLDAEDAVREAALKACREITRFSASAIKNIHQGKEKESSALIAQGLQLLKSTKEKLRQFPEIQYAGFLHSAEKELAEAVISFNVICRKILPGISQYDLDSISYLHGLAESIGEIRRYILDSLRKGSVEEGELYLAVMDEIYYLLSSLNYTDAITRGIRRQVDYVRSMVERTSADVTSAVVQRGRS